ncbi:GNAT family N-acetyltransferase [Deinococcus sp.]|uniref:GNAT family N-acetyltransferase n=1 Tax=Deinococcus sp. TaxID=47478 RepID=UPI003C7B8AA7
MSGSPEASFGIGFLPLSPERLGLLHGWLQQPHVRAFWDDGHRELEQVQEHYFGPDPEAVRFLFTLAGRPAGYLQTYLVGPESDCAEWRAATGETWGLDLLLGAVADTGRGYGPQATLAFVKFWKARRPGLSRLLIDPDVRNLRAVRAYREAGFTAVRGSPGPEAVYRMLALDL